MHYNPNHRSVAAAAVAASILTLVFDLAYHTLVARFEVSVPSNPVVPQMIQRLPMHIGNWTGQDIPLDEAIVRMTGTDGHISRRYSLYSGAENVGLYIAYGVTARALAPHRPEVCYVSAGWTLMDRRSAELPLENGGKLPCSIFRFSMGGLNAKRIVVLDYFIVDGQHCGDVSLLQSRAWRGSDTVNYVVQVQISSTENLLRDTDSVTELVTAFAVDSALSIDRLFKHIGEDQSVASSRGLQDGNGPK
jgi:EpsI family protein